MRPMTHATYGDYEGPTMAPRLWGPAKTPFPVTSKAGTARAQPKSAAPWPLDTSN